MGYQESFVMVRGLAEAAGIKRAFDDLGDRSSVSYAVTDVPKFDMPMGSEWGFITTPDHCWVMPKGMLCVIVCGQRRPLQLSTGRWEFIDAVQGVEWGHYYDYFDPLDDMVVDAAWNDNPELAQRAYEAWRRYLEADCAGRVSPPPSNVREAVEKGVYGIAGDEEWLAAVCEMRTTPWQRDVAAGKVRLTYEERLAYTA